MNGNKILLSITGMLNLISFAVTGIDKYKSKHNKWRIKERTLFILAAVGGSIGVLLGIYAFRHKTKHMTFVVGIPIIIIIQVLLVYYCIKKS